MAMTKGAAQGSSRNGGGEEKDKNSSARPTRSSKPQTASGNGHNGGNSGRSGLRSFLLLALIFILALGSLVVVYSAFPELDEEEYQYLKLPKDVEEAKNLARVLSRYTDKYNVQVLSAFFCTYIFLQAFAIPGSIALSIISGFLYPFYLALPLVCLCSGIGAALCYLMSFMITHRLVEKYIPDRIAEWQQKVDNHRDNLFNYMLFLRITPLLPNWLINVAAPVVNVPLGTFFFGTVLGVAPPSFIMIQAGTTLYKLTNYSETFSMTYVLVVVICAVLSLLPVFFKQRLRQKLE